MVNRNQAIKQVNRRPRTVKRLPYLRKALKSEYIFNQAPLSSRSSLAYEKKVYISDLADISIQLAQGKVYVIIFHTTLDAEAEKLEHCSE